MSRDRALLTAVWVVALWIFLRYWDVTVRAEAILVWSAVFTALFVAAAWVGSRRCIDDMKGVWSAAILWTGLVIVGSAIGLLFPLVPIGSRNVQSVALLRVFDLIVPLWILVRGVHRVWVGRAAVAAASGVPVLLLVMLWWLTVRMSGESHEGALLPLTARRPESGLSLERRLGERRRRRGRCGRSRHERSR